MLLKRAATVLAVLALAGVSMVALSTPAQAHGGLTYPATRTYACYVNGLEGGAGGNLNPTNPACADAWNNGDQYAFWNWFGNLISNADGRHREIIPDGQLCGPTAPFAAFNAARTDWPVTQVQSGATVRLRYNAWAPHPGTWYQYVTRDDWNPNQPLRWSDLEPAPFDEETNPPIDGSGPHGPEYTWNAQLPNKTGRHIIYSIWQRSDSPEAFYNCSDVVFSGDPTEPPPPPPPPPPVNCAVSYATPSTWDSGFVGDVRITNTGTTAINGWRLDWTYANGQRVTNSWNSTIGQDDSEVRATNAGWNSTISPNSSVSFGFQATHTGANSAPTSFRLNGTECAVGGSSALQVAARMVLKVLADSDHDHSGGHHGHG